MMQSKILHSIEKPPESEVTEFGASSDTSCASSSGSSRSTCGGDVDLIVAIKMQNAKIDASQALALDTLHTPQFGRLESVEVYSFASNRMPSSSTSYSRRLGVLLLISSVWHAKKHSPVSEQTKRAINKF